MDLPLIRTPRLMLRPFGYETAHDDVDALHALWRLPEVRRYLWDDTLIARDVAEQLVESSLQTASQSGIGYWTLHPIPLAPSTAPLAGFCGFRSIDDGPEIELMYGLRGDCWGKGLATEACRAALDYLWKSTTFPRVYARTDAPNDRSVQVMLRLGMTRDLAASSGITYVLPRPVTPLASTGSVA